MPAAFNEIREFLELFHTDCRLQVCDLKVIAEVAVDVFVVVAGRQLAVLAVKPMAAEVVLPGGADAVPPPVTVGKDQPVQQGGIGVNTAALAHGHMMRRIETTRAYIAPCSGEFCHTVNGIF